MNQSEKEKFNYQKFCVCRNSKCIKRYCECFAAGNKCNKLCVCLDCHNDHSSEVGRLHSTYVPVTGKTSKNEFAKELKGCSCRKSFCVKKYCECFQEGILCNENCKCVDCQNNQSMSNKNVLIDLKKNSSSSNKHSSIYPIILSQNLQHLDSVIAKENPLEMSEGWLEEAAEELFRVGREGQSEKIIEKLLRILKNVDRNISKEKQDEFDIKMEEL